jgi:arginine/lysine/ornithine decarboxylase
MGPHPRQVGRPIDALLEFKDHYDQGASLQQAIRRPVAQHPRRCGNLSLRDLCDEMHAEVLSLEITRLLDEAFGALPGASDGSILGYLEALQDFGRKFPGFDHDIYGWWTGLALLWLIGPGSAGTLRIPGRFRCAWPGLAVVCVSRAGCF